MKIFFKKIQVFVFVVGLFYASNSILAQQKIPGNDRSVFYEYGEIFYSEAHAGASPSKDSSRIFVYFKISYDAMSFTAVNADERASGSFKSMPVVNVECRDDAGIIRQRAEWRRSVFVGNFDETNAKNRFAYGAVEMSVPAGKYTVSLDVTDQSNAIIKKVKLPPVNAQSFVKMV